SGAAATTTTGGDDEHVRTRCRAQRNVGERGGSTATTGSAGRVVCTGEPTGAVAAGTERGYPAGTLGVATGDPAATAAADGPVQGPRRRACRDLADEGRSGSAGTSRARAGTRIASVRAAASAGTATAAGHLEVHLLV